MGNPRPIREIRDFQDLEVWQLGKRLAVMAYEATSKLPASEMYGLTSQIRRAAVSVPGNVAEGFGRYHFADRIKFLLYARGSLNEFKSHVIIANELNFIDRTALPAVLELVETLSVKLNNFIATIRKRRE